MQIRQCKFIIYFENVKKLFYIFELFQKPNMIKYNKKYEDKKISMLHSNSATKSLRKIN